MSAAAVIKRGAGENRAVNDCTGGLRRCSAIVTAAAAIVLFLIRSAAAAEVGEDRRAPPPLVLISVDAFRWDYCALHPAETPHLRELMREGAHAEGLIPVYPSNTFANHYTLVTGLYPSHHGIINNDFFDPTFGAYFHYQIRGNVQDSRWWGGEPIWVTAIKQGRRACASFWVGSEAKIEGVLPTVWRPYDSRVPFARRFEELFEWLHRPPAERPAVITFYLEETNSIGHKYGPDSPELVAAIKMQDGRIGEIMDRLKTEHLAANLVIVSDHGMTSISPERVILLDDFINPKSVQVDFDGPAVGLRPNDGDSPTLMRALGKLGHATAYRVEDLPRRFHIDPGNPRNPPVWLVADEGWEIYFRAKFELFRNKFNHGEHGYDPQLASMHGIFIACGPSIKSGVKLEALENIHVYNFLCALAGLKPAPNDGDDRITRAALKESD